MPKTSLSDLLHRFDLKAVKINTGILDIEFDFQSNDKDAAWELYVEMLTRIVLQPLPPNSGDEKSALDSVYSLFPNTREILRRRGSKAIRFSKIAIPVLNQVVRLFTTKWHKRFQCDDPSQDELEEFRRELKQLQKDLCNYAGMLAEIAGVEDLTDLEQAGNSELRSTPI